jgi:uncharacterized membrane protein YadS
MEKKNGGYRGTEETENRFLPLFLWLFLFLCTLDVFSEFGAGRR